MYSAITVFLVAGLLNGAMVPAPLQASVKDLNAQINASMQIDYTVVTQHDCKAVENRQWAQASSIVHTWEWHHPTALLYLGGEVICLVKPSTDD